MMIGLRTQRWRGECLRRRVPRERDRIGYLSSRLRQGGLLGDGLWQQFEDSLVLMMKGEVSVFGMISAKREPSVGKVERKRPNRR